MKIEVFESSCCNTTNLFELVLRAVNESDVKSAVTQVTDTMETLKRGIIRTPALVVDGKVVCAGRVPKFGEIVNWIGGDKS